MYNLHTSRAKISDNSLVTVRWISLGPGNLLRFVLWCWCWCAASPNNCRSRASVGESRNSKIVKVPVSPVNTPEVTPHASGLVSVIQRNNIFIYRLWATDPSYFTVRRVVKSEHALFGTSAGIFV